MFCQAIQGIPYYRSIRLLAAIATREDLVCVRNIHSGDLPVLLYDPKICAAAEIDDHFNRGRNIDTGTLALASGLGL